MHPDLDRARVVVVDDEPANVRLLERVLRDAGVGRVRGLTDPRDAVDLCLQGGADLLLLDMVMPQMDGLAVLSALRSALAPGEFLPVIVLTADVSAATRDRALMAGAMDFVTKPFDHGEVVLRVRNLLVARQLYSGLQRHNALLQADLEAQEERARQRAEEQRERRQRVTDLLAGRALRMVFQPIRDLASGDILGVEALARFDTDPTCPPDHWFAEAAAVGLGTELELAAVEAALDELDRLPDRLFVSLNVSPAAVLAPRLADLVRACPRPVVLELTEHTRVDDHGSLLEAIRPLREHGTRLAVDDAGAGYAGLRQILLLRPDLIKLDIDLTRGIDSDPARRALSTALVAFAADIDATIIAEGIETQDELETLRRVGIGWGQGYHLGRPGAATTVRERTELRGRR